MYQVLYRKYRSSKFSELIGQRHVAETLLSALSNGRNAHAYLFTGPRGTGKTSCARLLARAVNCLSPQNGEPCNECALCTGIESGTVMDVVEIDAASNNGVDNIRELRDETAFTPTQAKFRVFIIDEVHMLSTGAFNALLKTLEEPPSYVLFILATTDVNKLPATVLSRCQRFDFRRIPANEISEQLLRIAALEGLILEPAAALLLARVADGGMRDAFSLLDRCRAETQTITEAAVAGCIGLADRRYLFALFDAVLSEDHGAIFQKLAELHQNACDMERLCEDLLMHARTLLLLHTLQNPRDFLACTDEDFVLFQEQAKRCKPGNVLNSMELFGETLGLVKKSSRPQLELELCFLKLCACFTPAPEKISQEKISQEISQEKISQEEISQAQEQVQSIPDGKFPAWENVLTQLQKQNPALAGMFRETSATVQGTELQVASPNPALPALLKNNAHRTILEALVTQVTGQTLRVCAAPPDPSTAPPGDPLAQLFRSNQT